MQPLRAIVLNCLPKVALSRLCGLVCSVPLPRRLRPLLFRWFARRYGADLGEVLGNLDDFRSLQHFFQRPLRPDARPIASTALVWPCDGRIVTTGPVVDGAIEQVKGRRYALADLLGDTALAAALADGSQVTIYLAPGDYHRVHAPFAGEVLAVQAIPGTLFPVNGPAVRSIDRLFVRNSRHVFACRLADGRAGAVVMVGAYNVGDTSITRSTGTVQAGDELGRFGFGSTAIAIVASGGPGFAARNGDERVRMGAAATG